MPQFAIFLLISILTTTVVTISSAFALEENGVIEMPFTENPPAIDGAFTTTDEWKDASSTYVGDTNYDLHQLYILTKHDREFIYIMLDVISFQYDLTDKERTTAYRSYICFDTNNDASLERDENDFCFDSVEAIKHGLLAQDITYKTILRGKNSEKTSLPRGYEENWGFTSKNDPYEEGRDHLVYEIKIPISFLHKSDKYGFLLSFQGGSQIGNVAGLFPVSWPTGADLGIPETWATIMSSSNTITAPPVPVLSINTDSISFGSVAVSEKSGAKTITIKNLGTSTLKVNNIRTSGEFSVNAKTPADVSPGQSMTFDVSFAPLTLGEKSGIVTISSNDLSNPSYTISVEGKGTEKGSCLIATAAFGSELAPQVQFLREIRDNTILSTASGTSFMTAFNSFYYSFSPTIADLERQNPMFKETVKVAIIPLLSSLSLLQYVDIDSEAEMLGYGIGVILLNVGMYFVAPAVVIMKLRHKKF